MAIKAFNSLNLEENIIKALKDLEYEKPTLIQTKTIPLALKNRDILATAQSGSGKTAAFLLPIIDELIKNKNEGHPLRAIVLAPTRELAKQIEKSIEDYTKYTNIKKVAVYGGISSKDQAKKIAKGIDIIVATPGRLIEHIENFTVKLNSVNRLVVDEVDTMLEMGFLEDIEKIFSKANTKRQILMFSATLNQNVKKLAKEFLNHPSVVEVANQRSTVNEINQTIIKVDENSKKELLSYLIGSRNFPFALVFVNTKAKADELVENLELDGLKAACIHGDVRQTARAKALRKFKDNEIRVLVATDIAARGIDIQDLPVVINYELPFSAVDFTHRIGRTGRAGKQGEAITLLSQNEYKTFREIEVELIFDLPKQTVEGFEPNETDTSKRVLQKAVKKNRKKSSNKKDDRKNRKDSVNKKTKTTKKRKTTKRDR
ncbi:MAG: DEAD/DEAH box helicase [Campylobacterota bacterium]